MRRCLTGPLKPHSPEPCSENRNADSASAAQPIMKETPPTGTIGIPVSTPFST